MDDETRQAFQQAAHAFNNTAQAFENTAEAFLNLTGAFPTREDETPQDPEPDGDPWAWFRRLLTAGVIVVGLVVLIIYWPRSPPKPYYGIDTGLVFAHCDQPVVGLFRTSIELWGVDPADGAVMDNAHAEVDLTDHTSMTYSCDLVGGLTRRMFDARFQRTVVQVRDPGTGAEWVAEVALTDGDPPRPPAPVPESRFAPHPHEDLAVYGPDGQTVWYRSAKDGTVHRASESITDEAVTIDPQAVAFTVLSDEPERIFVQGDRTTDYYAADLALPNPTGDMAAAPGVLYIVAADSEVPLRCSSLRMDPSTACFDGYLGSGSEIRPAAWLDDRTLIAITGPERGPNRLLRIEMSDRGQLSACAAAPPSDWSYRAVAVDPEGSRFVADAVRDGQRVLFAQSVTGTGADQPTELPTPDVPSTARLITWQPDAGSREPIPHVCGGVAAR